MFGNKNEFIKTIITGVSSHHKSRKHQKLIQATTTYFIHKLHRTQNKVWPCSRRKVEQVRVAHAPCLHDNIRAIHRCDRHNMRMLL